MLQTFGVALMMLSIELDSAHGFPAEHVFGRGHVDRPT
jgi:hypothetical protein